MTRPVLYLRALRQVDHTVFAVADGQKTYYDPIAGKSLPFSSGQQVKRSMLDYLMQLLGEGRAPVEFRYKIDPKEKSKDGKKKIGEDIAVLPLHPKYLDMLLGGYMKASGKDTEKDEKDEGAKVIKRRSPLSISAMRPLHPFLAGTDKEKAMTFDRTNDANSTVVLLDEHGRKMSFDDMIKLLEENQQSLRKAKYIDSRNQVRAYGLFVYDVAIDLRRLFAVSNESADPEITSETREDLKKLGWLEKSNAFGKTLVAPKEKRDKAIPALAEALLEWMITSNQARTFSLMPTLAVALGDRANAVAAALRTQLTVDGYSGRDTAIPVLDDRLGASLFITPNAEGYIPGASGDPAALDNARQWLIDRMMAYDYEG